MTEKGILRQITTSYVPSVMEMGVISVIMKKLENETKLDSPI